MASFQQLDSGNWRALVRKKGFGNQSETFAKKKDAQLWAAEVERKIEAARRSGSYDIPKGATFADFIDKYIKDTHPVKPHGKNKAATLARLKKEFRHVAMVDMSLVTLNAFVDRRMRDRTPAGNPISGVTIAVDLSYISTVLHWIRDIKMYSVEAGIANEIRGRLGRRGVSTRSKTRERLATQSELNKIFAAYEKKKRQEIPMRVLIDFAMVSAMREAEICRISIEDIDRDARSVIIRARKDPKKKLENDQVVPLLPEAWAIVESQIGDRKSGRIFPYNERSVSASFTRICEECDIVDLRFHDFRHFAITKLFKSGLHIEQVALISGHKDWASLKRYTHINANDVQQAFKELQSGAKP